MDVFILTGAQGEGIGHMAEPTVDKEDRCVDKVCKCCEESVLDPVKGWAQGKR